MKPISKVRFYVRSWMQGERNVFAGDANMEEHFTKCGNQFCEFYFAPALKTNEATFKHLYCNVCQLHLCSACATNSICRYCGSKLHEENNEI